MKTYLNAAAIAAFLITGVAATEAGAAPTPVTVVTYIDAIPDVFVAQNEEQAQVLLKQMNADTQKEPGLISFTILRETGRPNHFTLLEVWQDEAAFAAHLASPHTRQFRKDLQSHIGSPYDTLVTTETKAD